MMPTRRPLPFALLALFIVFAAEPAALAQSPAWRTDYNAARREASDKNRPLLLDFGTENCFWCKKLDATTFRDPSVLALINEQFVPLRIDAEREPLLTQKLQIAGYPTVLLATAEGRIITVIEGYLES